MSPSDAPSPNRIVHSEWAIDFAGREFYGPAGRIRLTSREFDLLAIFSASPQTIFSRHDLTMMLYGPKSPYERSIDVLIHRLRVKVEVDHLNPIYIKSIRYKGYYFALRPHRLSEPVSAVTPARW